MNYSLGTENISNQRLFSLCNERKHQRYYNSQGSPIELSTDTGEITQSFKGMIIDDSFSGCGLLIITEEKLLKGQLCNLKIKNLTPILCQIIWLKKVDKNLVRLGVKYLIK